MRPEFKSDAEQLLAAEETLRLVAQFPPPEGVADRVHRRLRDEAEAPRGFWRLWLPAHRLQFAGAALLVAAIAASTIMVRHPRSNASNVPVAAPVPQQGTGMRTAGAERHPASLTPIPVPAPQSNSPKKKPGAGHALKHGAKPPAGTPAQATAKEPAPSN
jgi:hypothetical protein